MNEDRENIKMLFNDILNIITDDYNIINEFTIFLDNVINVSEDKFHAIAEMLNNLED